MQSLYVFYDPRCGVCTQIKEWLLEQPAYVKLRTIALNSPEAAREFPDVQFNAQDLVVVADTGEAWIGDHAWVIVLWALREFRVWSERLASPTLLPLARQAFVALSTRKAGLSRLLGLRSEAELRETLSEIQVPPCQI